MQRQRITGQRSSDTASTPFGDVATKAEAGPGHPDLNQFLNEFAAAPMDTGDVTSLAELNRPLGPPWARSSRSDSVPMRPRDAEARQPPARGSPE